MEDVEGRTSFPIISSTLVCLDTTYIQPGWPDVKIKRSPKFTISSLKSRLSSFHSNRMFSKVAQKVNIYLGNCSEKICHQNLSKIAQSGHTGDSTHPRSFNFTTKTTKKIDQIFCPVLFVWQSRHGRLKKVAFFACSDGKLYRRVLGPQSLGSAQHKKPLNLNWGSVGGSVCR